MKTLSFIAFQPALSYEGKWGAFISCGLETGNSIWTLFPRFEKHFYFLWFFWGRFWIQDRSRLLDRYYADFGFYRTYLLGTPTLWIFPGGPLTQRWLGGCRRAVQWLVEMAFVERDDHHKICLESWNDVLPQWKSRFLDTHWHTERTPFFRGKHGFEIRGCTWTKILFGIFCNEIYMKHLQNFIYVNKVQASDFCSINTKFWAACFVLMQLANLTQLHPWIDHHNFLEPKSGLNPSLFRLNAQKIWKNNLYRQ